MGNIKVSVLVPMYNVAEIISPCIKSLYAQTLTCFEIIFINDCSKDNTHEVVNELAAGRDDIRVKIISHDVNSGVAAARNTALDAAEGEYIYSLDADDWLEPDALETMYDEAKSKDADIVSCEWLLTFEKNEKPVKQADAKTGKELFEKFAYGVARWNLWLFMIRRELIESSHFRFMEGVNMGEDMMLMMKLCTKAKIVSVIREPLYHYIQTNGNALTKSFKSSIPQVNINVLEVERYLVENNLDEYLGLLPSLKLTLKLPLLISDKKEDYRMWEEWFPEASNSYNSNPCVSKRIRIVEWAAAHKLFGIVWLHNFVLNKVIYGVIYK